MRLNDFRSFSSRIPSVFRYFKLQPKITGEKVTINPVQYGLQGNGWGIRSGENDYSGARAIMGNVAYPLDDMDSDKVSQDEWSLIRSQIDIQFEIGELEVAASRENLSFNKATIRNVQKCLAKLVKEVSQKVQTELNACPTLWDARILAVKLSQGKYSNLKSIFGVGQIKYKGKEIEGGLGQTIVALPDKIKNGLHIEVFAPRNKMRRRYYGSDNTVLALTHDPTGISVNSSGFRFFLKDMDRGSHVRAKQVINESKDTNEEVNTVYLLEERVKGSIQALRDLLGYEGDIDPISTIERPKRASRGTADYNPMNAKRMLVYQTDSSHHLSNEKSTYWKMDKVDVRHGGIYVPISRYKVDGHDDTPDKYIEQYIRTLNVIGEDTTDIKIVGVKTALQDKVKADPDWITLNDYVKGKVEEFVEANDLRKHFIALRADDNANSDSSKVSNFIEFHHKEWDIADDSPIAKLVELVAGWKESADVAKKYGVIVSRLGIEWEDDKAKKQIKAMGNERKALYDEVVATYPMLKLVADSYQYDKGIVRDYIALIDRVNGQSKS